MTATVLTLNAGSSSVKFALFRAGGQIDRAALLSYVASCWPLLLDAPDVGRWAGEFVENVQAATDGVQTAR